MLEAAFWKVAFLWRDAKNVIEGDVNTGNLLLHFAAGLLIFSICAAAIRHRSRWTIAWFTTLIAAVLNEIVDITTERWPDIMQQFAEGGIDLAATMVIPTFLAVLLALKVGNS